MKTVVYRIKTQLAIEEIGSMGRGPAVSAHSSIAAAKSYKYLYT